MTQTYDREWHDAHKNDPNIKEARATAGRRRYQTLKNDPAFIQARNASGKKWRDKNKEVVLERRTTYYKLHPEYQWIDNTKRRAQQLNVPFNLTAKYLRSITPEICPVLGIPLIRSTGNTGPTDNSPTIDRIIPSLGYTKGNVMVVSKLANQIKSSATPDQILTVGRFYEQLFLDRAREFRPDGH